MVDTLPITPKGTRPGGRKKGVQNKTTQAAKECIALVAEALGGHEGLLKWVKSDPLNEKTFWGHIYPKLMPVQVSGEGGGPVMMISEQIREVHGG